MSKLGYERLFFDGLSMRYRNLVQYQFLVDHIRALLNNPQMNPMSITNPVPAPAGPYAYSMISTLSQRVVLLEQRPLSPRQEMLLL
ncbi:hypothetical protein OIDMADRAFT_20033 [Oidiodendron maius Zn]|uniref:Uncharacterized protein n=1 Tax=Oidiodendron maius (strain Zn) TaxID=913774 RepID=A0A0C3H4D5_OIDMZ|nr:hypothetical protein OIDMADRAFT_20033 [Oidiodendron maius Zn]